jgi:hypothetical protein
VLERVGWRFIHVRATRFCRDPEATSDWVVKELRRLGVEPLRHAQKIADPTGENLRNKVIRRAWQIMREQEWITDPTAAPPAVPETDEEAVTTPAAAVPELVLDDTTEPHFVIIEQAEESTVVEEEESTITSRHPS